MHRGYHTELYHFDLHNLKYAHHMAGIMLLLSFYVFFICILFNRPPILHQSPSLYLSSSHAYPLDHTVTDSGVSIEWLTTSMPLKSPNLHSLVDIYEEKYKNEIIILITVMKKE